jgi:hypothetical protein
MTTTYKITNGTHNPTDICLDTHTHTHTHTQSIKTFYVTQHIIQENLPTAKKISYFTSIYNKSTVYTYNYYILAMKRPLSYFGSGNFFKLCN